MTEETNDASQFLCVSVPSFLIKCGNLENFLMLHFSWACSSIISYVLMRKSGKKWKNIFYALQNHSYPFDVVEFAPKIRSYLLGWCQLCCSFHLDINSILLQSRYCHLIPLESIQFLSLLSIYRVFCCIYRIAHSFIYHTIMRISTCVRLTMSSMTLYFP